MTKEKTLAQKAQDILLETPREIHKCIEEGDNSKAFRVLSDYASQRVIEELEDLLQFPEYLETNVLQRLKKLKL